MKLKVFVGASKYMPKSKNIITDAKEVGHFLGKHGHTLLQGGNCNGVMGLTLHEFYMYSDDVEMIIPKVYEKDLDGLKYKKVYLTADLNERIKTIHEQSNKIVIMPGGIGTLHELLSANESKRAGEHQSEILVLNTDGYYNGTIAQIEKMKDEGLSHDKNIYVKFFNRFDDIAKHLTNGITAGHNQ